MEQETLGRVQVIWTRADILRCHVDRGCTAQLISNRTLIRMSAARPMQQVKLRDPFETTRQMQLLVQTAQGQGHMEALAMHSPTRNVKLYHTALDAVEYWP